MNRVEAALRRIATELDTRQVSWALVGGFAVSALIRSLTAAGYGLAGVVEQQKVGRLATAGEP